MVSATGDSRSLLSTRGILLGILGLVALELVVLLCLPFVTRALRSRAKRILAFVSSPAPNWLSLAERMLPASIGTRDKFIFEYPELLSEPGARATLLKKSLPELERVVSNLNSRDLEVLLASTFDFDNRQETRDEEARLIATIIRSKPCTSGIWCKSGIIPEHTESY